jgi:hypothetical protein
MRNVLLAVILGSCVVAAQSSPPSSKGNETRAAFLKVIDRSRVPLAPEVRALPSPGGQLIQEHVTFAVDAKDKVTAIVVRPSGASGRRPAIIQLHGTGGNKEQLVPRLSTLANRGFVAIAIDARYHGERKGQASGLPNPYDNAIFQAFQTGEEHPFFYDTVWDVDADDRLSRKSNRCGCEPDRPRWIFKGRHRNVSCRCRRAAHRRRSCRPWCSKFQMGARPRWLGFARVDDSRCDRRPPLKRAAPP